MEIEVSRFRVCDIDTVFTIQRSTYRPLYEKYHDDSSSPYLESKEAVLDKYTRTGMAGYLFSVDGTAVDAARIHLDEENRNGHISALCVLPPYQGKKIAQTALLKTERLYPTVERWFLDTILEEPGNCHLYEKIGYWKTGKTEAIHEKRRWSFMKRKRTNSSLRRNHHEQCGI